MVMVSSVTQLMEPVNRRIEPWTATLLGYLNHHLRQAEAIKYIYRGLEEMQEVQRTGDIFFPRNWAGALLGGHTSDEANAEVERFLNDNPDFPVLLRNKILQDKKLSNKATLSFFDEITVHLLPLTKSAVNGTYVMYYPSTAFLSSVVSALFSQQICLP